MSNIPPIDRNNPGPATELVGEIKQAIGVLPNIFATFAQSPAVLEGFMRFSGALGEGQLPAALREQIALTVAGENACGYCASAHTMMASAAGVSKVEANLNLSAESGDERTKTILHFVRDVVRHRGQLGDNASALNQLRAIGVTDAELVEIIANIGINLFTNYFNHLVDTEIDFPIINVSESRSAA